MVKGEYSSYKDLPLSIYQIQTKFRDEARPRSGIIRGREFVMKDSYSFDLDDAGLDISYQKHRDAYVQTFDRLGLKYNIVKAVSGAMGGSKSEEFLAPCTTGEDTYVLCPSCGYAANVEAMVTKVNPVDSSATPALEELDTPNTPTIDSLVQVLNERFGGGFTGASTLKNVMLIADGKAISVLVPGDRDVDLKRFQENLGGIHELRTFEDADFAKFPGLVKGYIGPDVLGTTRASGIRYLLDTRVVEGSAWVTGANAKGQHVINFVYGRDFACDGTIEAAEVRAGDACPHCAAPMSIDRGIEIGHVFQLGRKYAEALDLKVLDQNGKQAVVTMGSYGIGVSRAVAVVAETCHDELGLCWPRAIAPADVHVEITGKAGDDISVAGEKLAQELHSAGVTVLLDDRIGVSPGVKFKDAELLGMPTIVVVGKGLADGVVEVRNRATGERSNVPVGEAAQHIAHICKSGT
jgi:prolyl-tRNA synthetase